VAVSILKPPKGDFRSETEKFNGYIFNGHSPTDESVSGDVTAVAVGQSQRLYSDSGFRIFTGGYLSFL
jgi:hypothetical protein